MKNHEGCRRAFIWSSKAWYAKRDEPQKITFGMYHPNGGTSGEMSMRWIEVAGRRVPQLQAFYDAWGILALFTDVIKKLGDHDGEKITPEQFIEILLECGFVDDTAKGAE